MRAVQISELTGPQALRVVDVPEPDATHPLAQDGAVVLIDVQAAGVVLEARRCGIRVPEDLSLIGFDDSFLASRSAPPLTTVAQPLIEMGRLAVRSLLQLMAGEVVGTRHLKLDTHLVVRDSTAAPRS